MGTIEQYSLGQLVQLRAHPNITGAVIKVLPGEPEDRYMVFHDGSTTLYYMSQLEFYQSEDKQHVLLPFADFKARLTALQLLQPSISALYSLNAARINFVPYQFRPVLKFINSDRPRLLIADEVGVGKTIEAGLILRELQARQNIESVLIICPKALVTERKWELEMQRFDERFSHIDGPMLRHCISETDKDGEWPAQYSRSIIPFSLFDEKLLFGEKVHGKKPRYGLVDLDKPPRFDLVIVDEAHHLRNPMTQLHQGVRFFCEHAEAVLFLTATPIQLANNDLFILLNMLRPDLIRDLQSFEYMSAPNPHINRAIDLARSAMSGWEYEALLALIEAGKTTWGESILKPHPVYQKVISQLQSELSPESRLSFIRETENLHSFSGIINRTRRRDIGNFTTRKANTVEVEFTASQQILYNDLLAAQSRILRRAHGDIQIKFLMTTIRRQTASCLYGLAPMLKQILTRRLFEVELEEEDERAEGIDLGTITTLAEDIDSVLCQAENLDSTDPKLEAFLNIVSEKQLLQNNKILLFSSFRHTLNYLKEHLVLQGYRIGLVHGNVPDEERRELRRRFSLERENPDTIDILLSSEIGCEGLDYQFCDCLVNYDLPWNPMRIEQRIGRIDRYGQTSEAIAIYNFITPGTVDYDIYYRCHWRIGVFRQAIGGSEEILGTLTSELCSIAENFELTIEERQRQLQQISDNSIRIIQEQEALEEQQIALFGIALPQQQLKQEVMDASSAWLTPKSLQNLIQFYLIKRCGGESHILGDKPIKTLRLNQDARNTLLSDFANIPRRISPIYREWEKWLKGNLQHLEITFDQTSATEKRGVTFLTPIHPFILQAATYTNDKSPFQTACYIKSKNISPGEYPYTIYQWRKWGLRQDTILQPICEDQIIQNQLLSLLDNALTFNEYTIERFPNQEEFDKLEQRHYSQWISAKAEHNDQTHRIALYRIESLKASYQARVALLRDQIVQSTDDKIRRMRQSQFGTATADYERRLAEILEAESRTDIISQVVAYGVLVVKEDINE